MKRAIFLGITVISSIVFLSGCQATGQEHAANVFKADQVNTKQEAKTVQILAVMPAQIEVDNTQQKQAVQMGAGLIGALAGAAVGRSVSSSAHHGTGAAAGAVIGGAGGAMAGGIVKDTTLVNGVSLTYVEDGKTFNSAQVGKVCEFQPGLAVVISSKEDETRIQANSSCPKEG
jgi:outer membrane lipoprotein SlyB